MIEELKKLKFNKLDYDLRNLSKFLLDYYKSESENFDEFKDSQIIIEFCGKRYNIPNSPELERYLWESLDKLIFMIENDRD